VAFLKTCRRQASFQTWPFFPTVPTKLLGMGERTAVNYRNIISSTTNSEFAKRGQRWKIQQIMTVILRETAGGGDVFAQMF
jgi:hypothetical protein